MISLQQRTTLRAILALVAEAFDLSVDALTGETQAAHVAQARAIAMYLSRKYTGASLPRIGAFYHRHHTTVLHAVRVTTERIARVPDFADTVRLLETAIAQGEHTVTLHFEPTSAVSRVAKLEARMVVLERHLARTA